MTALIILASIVAYIGAGAWAFGYVRGATNDKQNGWATPMPTCAALFWPFAVTIIGLSYLIVPLQHMGFAFQQAKLKSKKKRIAAQEKIRIQLKESEAECAAAERELELEFQALDAKEVKRAKSK